MLSQINRFDCPLFDTPVHVEIRDVCVPFISCSFEQDSLGNVRHHLQ